MRKKFSILGLIILSISCLTQAASINHSQIYFPDFEERKAIIQNYAARIPGYQITEKMLNNLANRTNKFSVQDIEMLFNRAIAINFSSDTNIFNEDSFEESYEDMKKQESDFIITTWDRVKEKTEESLISAPANIITASAMTLGVATVYGIGWLSKTFCKTMYELVNPKAYKVLLKKGSIVIINGVKVVLHDDILSYGNNTRSSESDEESADYDAK